MITCIKCGAHTPPSARRCGQCGASVQVVLDAVPGPPPAQRSVAASSDGDRGGVLLDTRTMPAAFPVAGSPHSDDGAPVTRLTLELRSTGLVAADVTGTPVSIRMPSGTTLDDDGAGEVLLPAGARVSLGAFTLLVCAAESSDPFPQSIGGYRSALTEDERHRIIRQLERDCAEVCESVRHDSDDGEAYAALATHAVQAATAVIAEGDGVYPEYFVPRLAVGALLEGLGKRFVGEGKTVWLRRSVPSTLAAFIGLGDDIMLTVDIGDGPETLTLPVAGFSRVASIACRRLAAAFPGIECRYDDAKGEAASVDLSMDRLVVCFPRVGLDGLDVAWQLRVMTMLNTEDW